MLVFSNRLCKILFKKLQFDNNAKVDSGSENRPVLLMVPQVRNVPNLY